MSGRRVLVLYGSLLLGFAVVLCRLFWLCSNTAYAARAEAQSTATLTFPARRGNFYDCNGHLLTGLGEQWLALSLPGEGSYTKLYPYASKAGQAMLYQKRNASRPFLVEVTREVSAMGAWCYAVPAPLWECTFGVGPAGLSRWRGARRRRAGGGAGGSALRHRGTGQVGLCGQRTGKAPERDRAEACKIGQRRQWGFN